MLKLHAGISKKVGLPGYSSASASCTIEAELDSSLLNDSTGFQIVVRRAYDSCEQAVVDQICRLTKTDQETVTQPQSQLLETVETGSRPSLTLKPRSQRPATTSQVRAIRAISGRRKIDLMSLLRDRYGLDNAEQLGVQDASNLIDELKNNLESIPGTNADRYAHANGSGNGHRNGNCSHSYSMTGGAQ